MTDYAAEQEMEVEALRAILMDEFEGKSAACRSAFSLCCRVQSGGQVTAPRYE